jgi:hypothetical protein
VVPGAVVHEATYISCHLMLRGESLVSVTKAKS